MNGINGNGDIGGVDHFVGDRISTPHFKTLQSFGLRRDRVDGSVL
ncbi:MAG: hypothetical protein P8L79_11065 [Rhodospirillaceae bacterium]|jgi:hypothetical protein|nr:hypothetical protein [Rhodospirillaceae bacterium]